MARDEWQEYFQAVKRQDWRSAKAVLLRLAESEKNNPQIFLKIGDVCQRAGEVAESVAAYGHASQILRMQGFIQKALVAYKIALRLDPDNQEIISRTEILMDDLATNRATPLAERVPLPSEVKKSPLHSPAPETTITPDWLETTSFAPEKPDAKLPSIGTSLWLEPTVLESGNAAGEISDAGIPSWLETTSLSPDQPAVPGSDQPTQGGITGDSEPSPFAPAPAQDEHDVWIESAFEALDKGLFVSDTRQAADPEAKGSVSGLHNDAGPPGTKIFIDQQGQVSDMPAEMQQPPLPLSEHRMSGIPEVFSSLPEDMATRFLHDLSRRTYTDNQPVIKEGDSGDSLYIIRSGTAKIITHLLGQSLELAVLREGDLFGEVGFLTGRPRTASVIAVGALEVYEISRCHIEKLIEAVPDIMAKIEGFYETRVQDTIRQMKNSLQHDLPDIG